ncbi:hypothetical protein BJ165DRAFT_1409859 [Panaeolus papilionaceus]|nr:hypothetical protein BJ165DRAFT_1409859 [Panaeolus papilionaceus]
MTHHDHAHLIVFPTLTPVIAIVRVFWTTSRVERTPTSTPSLFKPVGSHWGCKGVPPLTNILAFTKSKSIDVQLAVCLCIAHNLHAESLSDAIYSSHYSLHPACDVALVVMQGVRVSWSGETSSSSFVTLPSPWIGLIEGLSQESVPESCSLTLFLWKLEAIERKVTLQWGYGLQILPSTKEKPADVEEIKEAVPEPVTSSSPTVDSKEDHPASPATTAVPAVATPPKSLSLVSIILKLAKSSRMLMPLSIVFMHGAKQFYQEPTIPLHLQSVRRLNSSKVGLVFVAAVLPTLVSSCLLLTIQWWILLILEVHLTLFILSFAVQSFFILSILASVTAELASVANSIEDVGYAHVYSAFNLIYGIGTTGKIVLANLLGCQG